MNRPAAATTARAIPSVSSSSAVALLAALGGGILLGVRSSARGRARPIATLAGLALIGVAARRPIADALRKAGNKRRSAELRFSFVVDRPVEEVFAFCANFENFPRFIHALREVRDNGDGRSHWCASTPSGGEIEWKADTTKFVTNSVIGWRNSPGAPIATNGVLRFSPEGTSTCVRVAIDYHVYESGMLDALAALVNRRQASEMEHDIRHLEHEIAVANDVTSQV
ncbi:MAG: SRPBCC family protein [bacterium]